MRLCYALSALLLVGVSAAGLAAETAPASLPGGYVSPFASYQGWSEPDVRDWQETHRLLGDGASAHAGHAGMAMPEPDHAKEEEKPPAPKANGVSPHSMPGMSQGASE